MKIGKWASIWTVLRPGVLGGALNIIAFPILFEVYQAIVTYSRSGEFSRPLEAAGISLWFIMGFISFRYLFLPSFVLGTIFGLTTRYTINATSVSFQNIWDKIG